MRLLSVLGRQRGARRPPAPAPRALARAHRPDRSGRPGPRRTRMRAALLRAVGADPDDDAPVATLPRGRGAGTRCAWSTAGCCCGWPPATWPTTSASTTRRGAVRPRRRHARRGAGRRPRPGRRGGASLPARRDRDGQVRRPRAQLRQRRRRDLRGRARRRRTTSSRRCGPPPSWPPPDAGLLRPHRRGHDLAGRRRRCARRASPGPLVRTLASHRGYYERWAKTWEFQALLKARPVAGDLALGPGVRRDGRARWCGRPRSGRASSSEVQAMRRRVHRAHPRRARPSGSSSSARAGCATSSSPSSCCSWCTAAPTSGSGRPTTLSALAAAHPRRVRRPRGRRGAARRLRVPAHPRAPDPALAAAPHPRRARGRGVAAPAGPRSMGYIKDPVARARQGSGSTTGARCGGCTRSCSTGRCSPRWRGSPATRRG